MTDHRTTDLRLGEGFAYFRWHSITWKECCHCTYTFEQNFCGLLWDRHER